MKKSLALFIIILTLLTGCIDLTLHSVWNDHDITIDGKDTEWRQETMLEKNFSCRACNDADYLYLCFSVTDKTTKAQMMGLFKQDFYLWFEPPGRKKREFGLRFSNASSFMNESLLGKIRYLQVHLFQTIGDEMMKNLDIKIMNNYIPVASLTAAKGIDVGIGVSKNGRKVTYELKVPLVKSAEFPYAIGAISGKPVDICFETTAVDVNSLRKQLGLDNIYDMESLNQEQGTASRRQMMQNMGIYTRDNYETLVALENFRPIQLWCRVILASGSQALSN
jgi:hypothetical protein